MGLHGPNTQGENTMTGIEVGHFLTLARQDRITSLSLTEGKINLYTRGLLPLGGNAKFVPYNPRYPSYYFE